MVSAVALPFTMMGSELSAWQEQPTSSRPSQPRMTCVAEMIAFFACADIDLLLDDDVS